MCVLFSFVFSLPLRNEYVNSTKYGQFLTSLTAVSFLGNAQASVRLLDAVTHDLTVAALETTDYVMERFDFVVVRFKILAMVTVMVLVMCKTKCG